MEKLLQNMIEKSKHICAKGKVANYIPALQKANPNHLGIVISNTKGEITGAGDINEKFTMQSISKAFTLLYALHNYGEEYVFKYVGYEPIGDAFNSVVKLETSPEKKPYNSMINAGAIAICSLANGHSKEDRFNKLLGFYRTIADNPSLKLNQEVYESEHSTGDRNRAISYFLKGEGLLELSPEDTLDLYFKQCSVEVDAVDLSNMALFLARAGRLKDGTQFVDENLVRIVRSQIALCGMYDESGEFARLVGIPSKSGVGGGIISVVPEKMGIGVFGPALDSKGNSIGGIEVLRLLSKELRFGIY